MALFVALGGSAYAAGVLPANSVGRPQLQAGSVTSSKLAPSSVGRSKLKTGSVTADALAPASVGLNALDPTLRTQLIQEESVSGPQGEHGEPGPAGAQGVAGPRGPSGPGAVRVHYFEHASASATPTAAVDIAGLHLIVECQDSNPGTQLNFTVKADEASTFIENINTDGGPGLPGSASANSANLQIDLPAGTTVLGGPSAASGQYSRIFAHVIDLAPDTTVDLTIVIQLDGTAGTCAVDGVGVPATS
jgi:hypothetical protein